MVVKYRSEHYRFLNRKGDLIGVTAYRFLPIYNIIEDYCKLQEKYDEMYGYGTLVGLVEEDMAKRFDSAIMKFAVTIRRTDEHNYKEKQKELEMRAEICKRGLEAMHGYVKKNNLYEEPEVWVGQSGDKMIGIVREADKLLYAKNSRKDIDCFYTMSEIMEMVKGYEMTTIVKEQLDKADIKEAKVVEVQPIDDKEFYDDEVPF